jgi:hypothetical protein
MKALTKLLDAMTWISIIVSIVAGFYFLLRH